MLSLLSFKSSGCCFQCVVAAHLISSGFISINVVTAVSPNDGCGFADFVTSLFQKAVDTVFHVLSLHF